MFNFKQQLNLSTRILVLALFFMASQFAQAQLDDPTRPANIANVVSSSTDAVTSSWDLSSILVSPQRRVAIINGKTVKSGETLAGAKVVMINETSVKLKYRGEIILLKLFSHSVKTARDTQ
ncbi:MAG: hypothetical protein KAT25_06375 [Sulfuriflexus sp.]|nr:hypothetical protein [Sulfuriflexus sp.]